MLAKICRLFPILVFASISTAQENALPAGRVLELSEDAPSLFLPGDSWTVHQEKRNQSGTGIYYLLSDSRAKVYFSAYIERTNVCKDADECLKLSLENVKYRKAEDRSDFGIDGFKATTFFLDQPNGLPIKQVNLLASAYVDGHWIDLHFSAAGAERPSPEPLELLLRSLRVRSAP